MTVEPPPDDALSPGVDVVQPRKDNRLRQDLAMVLDITPSDADDWIEANGKVNAEERIQSYWFSRRHSRSLLLTEGLRNDDLAPIQA